VSSPLAPGDTVSERGGLASLVEPVEITHMTTVVPPRTFELMTTRRYIRR